MRNTQAGGGSSQSGLSKTDGGLRRRLLDTARHRTAWLEAGPEEAPVRFGWGTRSVQMKKGPPQGINRGKVGRTASRRSRASVSNRCPPKAKVTRSNRVGCAIHNQRPKQTWPQTSLANVTTCPGRKDGHRQGGKGREQPRQRNWILGVRSPTRFRSRPDHRLQSDYDIAAFVRICGCALHYARHSRPSPLPTKDGMVGLTSPVHVYRQCVR